MGYCPFESRYKELYLDTTGIGAQRMGHDTARGRPRHGRGCATIRSAVRTIRPSARVRVAWLTECVAIQGLYHGLGWHCVAIRALIQAEIRRKMRQDTVLCAGNTASGRGLVLRYKNCIVTEGEGSSAATQRASACETL